jgi:hypothetical protein
MLSTNSSSVDSSSCSLSAIYYSLLRFAWCMCLTLRAQDGRTALLCASFGGCAAIVQLLIEAGADMGATANVRVEINAQT